MSFRLLLLGSNGQLGTELRIALAARFPAWKFLFVARSEVDLMDRSSIVRAMDQFHPHIVINAAAYTAVDAAESNREAAFLVNAESVGELGRKAEELGTLVIHYSTDYVFDGASSKPYCESDMPSPLSVYGESKLKGEMLLRDSGAAHLLFRAGWLYSMHHSNFVVAILRRAQTQDVVRVVNDQIGTPTPAALLAAQTCRALGRLTNSEGFSDEMQSLVGTYHVAAAGETSWYEFARMIMEEAVELGINLRVKEVIPISTEEFGAAAKRPSYSALDCGKFSSVFSGMAPDWRAAFRDVFRSEAQQGITTRA